MKSKLAFALLGLALLTRPLVAVQSSRASDEGEDRYVAIRCGKLITGNGEEKEKVTLLAKNGKVETISEKIELPHPCEVIDASDMVVMPGLIDPHSRLSLLDYQRAGARADLKVADEFFPAKDAFAKALENGFTTLMLVPAGSSGITGRALLARTADVGGGFVVAGEGPVKMNHVRPETDRKVLSDTLQAAKREIEKVEKAKADWEAKKKAAEEQKKKEEEAKKQPQPGNPAQPPNQPPNQPPSPNPNPTPNPKEDQPPKPDGPKPEAAKPEEKKEEPFQPPPIAPPLQPIVDLIQKKPGALAFVRLGGASTYLHYLEATKDFEIAHVLMAELQPAIGRPQAFFGVAGADLQWVAKQFGENKELVVMRPTLSYLQGSVNLVNVPQKLVEAGARVAFTPASDGNDDLAAFRYSVGEVIKGGMKRADAIAALTKNAAAAIGLADRLGTLEPGRDCNLLILSGDPFDVQSQVERVVIEGRPAWKRAKRPTTGS